MLTTSLVDAELRAAPYRIAASAALLAVVGLLCSTGAIPGTVGLGLGAAVAWAATAGAAEDRRRLGEVLDENGLRRRGRAALGAALGLTPGLVAAPIVLLAGGVAHSWGDFGAAIALCTLVPAAVGALASRPDLAELRTRHQAPPSHPWRIALLVATWLASIAIVAAGRFPILLPVLLVLTIVIVWKLSRRHWSIKAGIGVVLIVWAALVAGASTTFPDLTGRLVFALPAVLAGVALVATGGLAAFAALVDRWGGGRFRLAMVPLARRLRAVGPPVAVLTVVCTALVLNAVVGSSFGAREAKRGVMPNGIVARAGTGGDQALAPLSPTDDSYLLPAVAGANVGPTRVLVIDAVYAHHQAPPVATTSTTPTTSTTQVGAHGESVSEVGSNQSSTIYFEGRVSPFGGFSFTGLDAKLSLPSTPLTGPTWIGEVDPASAGALHVAGASRVLAGGGAVVLNGLVPGGDLELRTVHGSLIRVGAVVPDRHRIDTDLPAVLVGPTLARRLGGTLSPAEVVVTPAPGHTVGTATLVGVADRLVERATFGAVPQVGGADPALVLGMFGVTVDGGNDHTSAATGGPLNAVPWFGHTGPAGRQPLVPYAFLLAVVAVVTVAFALGTTATDDAVMGEQGAPRGLRSVLAAIQAAVLTSLAAAIGLACGLAVTATGFARYDHAQLHASTPLPPIPYVVPSAAVVTMIAMPCVAAVAAAAIVALRRPASFARLATGWDR